MSFIPSFCFYNKVVLKALDFISLPEMDTWNDIDSENLIRDDAEIQNRE